MQIKVLYFGLLTEITGATNEYFENIDSSEHLLENIQLKYPQIKTKKIQISVNKKITSKNTELNDGDEIALLPPFTGG